MSPAVSIILPIYNGASTLQSTLTSLLEQTFQDFEIVACIDGTNDASEEILKSQNDNRIKIFNNVTNYGLGRTLNRLIALTHESSEYFAIAEQDDWYYPYRLEKQVNFLEQNPQVGLVTGIAEFCDYDSIIQYPGMLANGKQYPTNPNEMLRLNYREGSKVQQTCMMVRKKVHLENGLYFSQHFHTLHTDWLYVLRFAVVSEIHGLPIPLVKKDRRYDRVSATKNLRKMLHGSKELIKNTYWEFSHILSKQDYQYALNTVLFTEGRNGGINTYLYKFIEALLNNPTDPRFGKYFKYLTKKVKNKIGL